MPIAVDYVRYHQSLADELKATQDRIRCLIADRHWLTDGEHKEAILRSVLRSRLPEFLHVGRGFVCYQDAPSTQLDVLITDKGKPTLFREGDLVIVTPDCVEAIIEVKTKLGQAALSTALATLAEQAQRVRDAKPDKPWTGLFVLDGPEGETDNAYKESARMVLEAISQACRSYKQPEIDCVAFGPEMFVRYWRNLPCTPSGEGGWSCYVFNKEAHKGLAPAFFVGNLVWRMSLGDSSSMTYAWFPIDKEQYRVAHIGLTSNEVVFDSSFGERATESG